MARNPYAGFNTADDPYTSTNGYAAPANTSSDYEHQNNNRYGVAPPRSSAEYTGSTVRQGGYGGFGEPAPPARANGRNRASQPEYYGSRSIAEEPETNTMQYDESTNGSSPRRAAVRNGGMNGRSTRQRPNDMDDAATREPQQTLRRSNYESDDEKDEALDTYMPPPRNRNNRVNGYGLGAGQLSGSGDGTRQIQEVLQYIQSEWAFMAQDKCVPVQVALQLMDSSSLGRAKQSDQFRETHTQLQRALKAIVNEHHQGFNSSIGTFHKIQSSIQSSQTRIRGLKESLAQAKTGLSTTRPELKGLASTSHSYDEMIQVLMQIEQLRLVSDKLEARISEKRFLSAVDVLQDAVRILRKPEMDNIGALTDLRLYLTSQETSLTDILIEELHNHLYLRSPYCQDRWKAHAKEQSNGASSIGRDLDSANVQPLWVFLEESDFSVAMVEDPTRNPEVDSYYYIQLLVESLHKMGHLDSAVNAIEQRLPVELFKVVDKTNIEVDGRHPSSLRGNTTSRKGTKNKIDLGMDNNDVRSVVVYDLLWSLYAKFEAIAEGHRVFHDVVSGIVKRQNIRNADSLTSSFRELWLLYQNEIRSLLHDYLATDSNIYRMNQAIDPSAELFRRGPRKKDRKLFSLTDTDKKSIEMTTELDDLGAILKASVPGLVSDGRAETGDADVEDATQTDGAATGHKMLIEPSVFNMGLLLPPSLTFLQRLKDIVPPGPEIKASTLTSFLDDFLVNVFLPQIDETLVKLSSQVVEESDAFQEFPQWHSIALRPVFRGSAAFFDLLAAFCRMLDTIPHDQAFSQLVITQLVSYYDKCSEWYKSLVSTGRISSGRNSTFDDSRLVTSAAIAQGPGDIHDTIKNLWTSEAGYDKELIAKEIGLLLLQTNEVPLIQSDIIHDRKTISALCLLYTSLKWLTSKIEELRHITEHNTDSSRDTNRRSTMRLPQTRRWSVIQESAVVRERAPVYLPMTQETVQAFDKNLASYQELAGTVLLTIHMELRTQIIYTLAQVLSPTSAPYVLKQVVNDPDPRIITLNADLVAFDSIVTTFLPSREINFLRNGLGQLIDTALVTNAAMVKSMNSNGCGRMQLNILVLQQNLKNIEENVSLQRAAEYFDLFTAGPDVVVKKAKEAKERGPGNVGEDYSYDELKTLVELCYSEKLADSERGISNVARRSMGDKLLQLSEVMWQT